MTTHILSMTYQPKIAGVMDGTIRQTIRRTERIKVGDKLILHTWAGKPYRSPWGQRTNAVVATVELVDATATGIRWVEIKSSAPIQIYHPKGMRIEEYHNEYSFPSDDRESSWRSCGAMMLARADGIQDTTPANLELGLALKEVLEKYHGKFTDEPVRFQVIRW